MTRIAAITVAVAAPVAAAPTEFPFLGNPCSPRGHYGKVSHATAFKTKQKNIPGNNY